MKDLTRILSKEKNELLYGNHGKDIEELYEGLIRLPKDEIIKLIERVAEYFKQKGG